MNIHDLEGNQIDFTKTLPDTYDTALLDFQQIATEFQKEPVPEKIDEYLVLSKKLGSSVTEMKIFPKWTIEQTNILANLGVYLVTIPNVDLAENLLTALYAILKRSSDAVRLFIDSNPGEQLLSITQHLSIPGRRLIFQIIELFTNIPEGVKYIITTPIITYIYNTLLELFNVLSTDKNMNSPNIDPTLDLLHVMISIARSAPQGIESNIPVFFNISRNCFENQHFRNFIKPGIEILYHLSRNLNNIIDLRIEIVKEGLFKIIIDFLSDETLRPNYIFCLHFASFFLEHIDPLFVYEIAETLPIPNIIDMFMKNTSDDELTSSCLNLFINLSLISSEFLNVFIDNKNFIQKLKDLLAMGSSEIRKSSMWLVWNMLYIGMREQQKKIFASGIFEYLEDSFYIDDQDFLIKVVINSIVRMIKSFRISGVETSEPFEQYVIQMRYYMRELVENEDPKVHKAALNFFQTYYPEYSLNT
ncbi:hypothetical protein TRFO_02797 [Tritrichomonas foetus]|uniref:Uncharacterized protein n=1 Tax=Tritrichomonas foetus TaxID=1144522 RepID=A0A1J4KWF5_9EUKA|nr:hypothetical protein TRFO_02797 [Tritrichomonas foetus]|eukprot:OHT15490.1 hypothetical protein TRFO_02797 [Tritrichomonas foetus]